MIQLFIYFLFVHVAILVPGYVLLKKTGIFSKKPALLLSFSYVISLAFMALMALAYYILVIPGSVLFIIGWVTILASLFLLVKEKLYVGLYEFRFPLGVFVLMSLLTLVFINLPYVNARNLVPDPEPRPDRNYSVLNVKILNLSDTVANDNYVPYRQAQFFLNRSDPDKDSFIGEWGVRFFQRTPLMGAITADFFILGKDMPPIAYLWSDTSVDTDNTYAKFQIIAHILNALFVIPAFFLLKKLFNTRTAAVSLIFIATSPFFLYNSFFSWPKSFVAFFILITWLLIFEKRLRYFALAGAVGGLAYLTHDLAVMYIGATCLLLLWQKQFKQIFVFVGSFIVLALPWLFTSSVIYKRPSTFPYYPFSIQGIPQIENGNTIMKEFFSTPITKIIAIKIDSLFYLLSPYQMIFSEGGQELSRRFWALTIFSVPGSLGLGLIIPTVIGLFKKIKYRAALMILALGPIVISVFVIGWPKGLGSLHFAQASVVLLMAIGVSLLMSLKRYYFAAICYVLGVTHLLFFVAYSYSFNQALWFKSTSGLVKISLIAAIIGLGYCAVVIIAKNKNAKLLKKIGL